MEKERPQLTADLEGNYLLDKQSQDLKAIGLFYAPTGGNVHKITKRIKQQIKGHKVEMFYIHDISPEKLLDYRNLILVSSTRGKDAWNNDAQDEWATFMPKLQKLKLEGRQIALVGLGDHVKYPNNFADGLRDFADVIVQAGGTIIGKTPASGYTYTLSRAVEDGLFCGLPLDEEFEPEKTEKRIEKWLSFVIPGMLEV